MLAFKAYRVSKAKGDKAMPLPLPDFTSEQIVELQKPATDAAVAAKMALNMLSAHSLRKNL